MDRAEGEIQNQGGKAARRSKMCYDLFSVSTSASVYVDEVCVCYTVSDDEGGATTYMIYPIFYAAGRSVSGFINSATNNYDDKLAVYVDSEAEIDEAAWRVVKLANEFLKTNANEIDAEMKILGVMPLA